MTTARIPVRDPVSGSELYAFVPASVEQCRQVMVAARAQVPALRDVPVHERLDAVKAVLRWLSQQREVLLDRIVAESARCRGDAMLSDLFQLTEDLLWLRDHAEQVLADERVPTPVTLLGKRSRILHQPHGVVLVISPWNLPLAIGLTAAMFALVAGNAVILKPSEHAPMAAELDQIRSLHPLLGRALRVVHGGGTWPSI